MILNLPQTFTSSGSAGVMFNAGGTLALGSNLTARRRG